MPSESSSFSDLSFNNIEAIEGLDTLVNLEDLSLSHNRISKIDSLDPLVNLQVLSLGNNQINNMMNVSTSLRRMPQISQGLELCQNQDMQYMLPLER